jgi:hypothetical protein
MIYIYIYKPEPFFWGKPYFTQFQHLELKRLVEPVMDMVRWIRIRKIRRERNQQDPGQEAMGFKWPETGFAVGFMYPSYSYYCELDPHGVSFLVVLAFPFLPICLLVLSRHLSVKQQYL